MPDLTELQRRILSAKREMPEASAAEIAEKVGCSEGYARDILNEFDTAHLDASSSSESVETPDRSNDEPNDDSNSSQSLLVSLFLFPFVIAVKSLEFAIGFTLWFLKLVLPPYGK